MNETAWEAAALLHRWHIIPSGMAAKEWLEVWEALLEARGLESELNAEGIWPTDA